MRSRCCPCVCVSPIVARQLLGKKKPYRCEATAREKRYRGNEYTRNNRRIFGRVVFNMARVVSRKVGD
jgi:hypothetical protein